MDTVGLSQTSNAGDSPADEDYGLWLPRNPYSAKAIHQFYNAFSHSQEAGFHRARCHVCLDLRVDLLESSTAPEDAGKTYHHLIFYEHLLAAARQHSCLVCAMFHRAIENFCGGVEFETFDVKKNEGTERCKEKVKTKEEREDYWKWVEVRLQFYREQDEPLGLPIGQARTLSRRADSAKCQTLLRTWFSQCSGNHEACSNAAGAVLPSRVIAVGSEGDVPHLYVADGVESQEAYAAFSHCWGNHVPLRALKANIQDLQREIQEEELPRTFRDALAVTRQLGIPYLWIESLCIIQDDKEDWARESARMGSYYSGAVLTIAADLAANSSEGCFQERMGNNWNTTRLEGAHYGLVGDVFVRGEPRENDFGCELGHHFLHTHEEYDNMTEYRGPISKLKRRAWTLQEWVLSRRIVHFTEAEMVWECEQALFCECSVGDVRTKDVKASSLQKTHPQKLEKDIPSLSEYWAGVVKELSGRDVTCQTDLLPAVSGVAELVSAKTGHLYVCGMWKSDLNGLLWAPDNGHHPVWRQTDHYAPSWSWASIVARIKSRRLLPLERLGGYEAAEIVGVEHKLSTVNPFGPCEWAKLKICGRIYSAICTEFTPHYHALSIKDRLGAISFHPDFLPLPSDDHIHSYMTVPEDRSRIEPELHVNDQLLLLVIQQHWDPSGRSRWCNSLVLKRVDDAHDVYRRVGVSYLGRYGDLKSPERLASEIKTITII